MGTLRYQAPELLDGEKWCPTTESDIFAFACTSIQVNRMFQVRYASSGLFLQILFDKEPYHWCKHDSKIRRAIDNGEDPWCWGDSPLEQILASCCHRSSSERPSISDVFVVLSALLEVSAVQSDSL